MFRLLKHYLFPHRGNNHRAKILHHSSLIVVIAILLLVSGLVFVVKKSNPSVLGISYSISESDLINLVNQQRTSNGLSALSENAALDDAARRKATDMFSKNYWAHFAPDGSTSPWGFIKAAGYSYTFAGENLAKGFSDPSAVVTAWMNSPTHRENILSDKYREVGFAIVPGTLQGEETVLVVQMFGSRNQDTVAQVSASETVVATKAPSQPSPTTSQIIQISITPTAIPAQVAAVNVLSPTPTIANVKVESKPVINAKLSAKAISTVGLSFLGFILAADVLIVERKKIPRLVGHNVDHIILIALFVLFIVLAESGVIV